VPDVSAQRPAGTARATGAPLARYTTLRLGGPAGRVLPVTSADEIMQSVRDASAAGAPTLVLGGGSNVVIADEGFPGVVILIRSSGLRAVATDQGTVTVRVDAGTDWDEVVATAVAQGWSGLECLSGIPGAAGATPIQNVSAYGQEVAETITAIRAYDRHAGRAVTMRPAECGFGYRTSVFKRSDRWVVLWADFRLRRSTLSAPVRYPELARALAVPAQARVPLPAVREAVLALRAGKGMVLDPADPDSRSAGSFFTNPVVDGAVLARIRAQVAAEPPTWPAGDGLVKLSAAWLIERAGFVKGYGRSGVAISSKHSLALTNRGEGTTAALLELAREIRDRVRDRSGVTLHPEPVLVGCAL
jgi:UDP-N-acetylmuramate dehydrogenase